MTREELLNALRPLEWRERGEWDDRREHLRARLIHDGCLIGTYHIHASRSRIHSSYRWDFELLFVHEDTEDIDVVSELSSISGLPELGIIRMKQEANVHRIDHILRHLDIKE